MSKIILFIAFLIIIFLAIFTYISYKSPKEKIFEGYIIWGRESVYFVNNVKINENNNFQTSGEEIWVVENDLTKELYNKALVMDQMYPDNSNDDIRIIKVKFKGLFYKNSKDVPVSPYNFSSKIKTTQILESSNNID